jgi:hypothetical protein
MINKIGTTPTERYMLSLKNRDFREQSIINDMIYDPYDYAFFDKYIKDINLMKFLVKNHIEYINKFTI